MSAIRARKMGLALNLIDELLDSKNRQTVANAQNAVNVLNAGGTGSSNASIWLGCWGEQTGHGFYPKASKAGLVFEDKGDVVPGFDSNNLRFEAYTSMFQWQMGLVVEDWRYTVRLCNIDTTTAGLAGPTPPDIFAILSKVVMRLPTAGPSAPDGPPSGSTLGRTRIDAGGPSGTRRDAIPRASTDPPRPSPPPHPPP